MSGTARRFLTMLSVVAVAIVSAAVAQDLEITRSTIGGGGVMFSGEGGFELSGTIGQPDSGALGGGGLTISGGLWFEQPPHDCNADGGVNLLDLRDLAACVSGPGGGLVDPSCACFDLSADDDVDLEDAAEFQRLFSGF